MARSDPSPGARLLRTWDRLSGLPGGKRLFSWLVGRGAPYTGTVGARIIELEPGYVRSQLRDRKQVRNHLDSIHAVALINVGEVTSGLAMMTGLPPSIRGIVSGLRAEYLKKARGLLDVECRCEIPEVREPAEHEVISVIRDAGGDTVTRVTVDWLLSPNPNEREGSTSSTTGC
ncbi:MAG: DUF4442 domain-containing protein [Acidobacteriota bacterium]|nr:DUF4442 domain-containing protein [Acidobacteriota bacterium]